MCLSCPARIDSTGKGAVMQFLRKISHQGLLQKGTSLRPNKDKSLRSPSSETVVFGVHAVSELLATRPEAVDRVYFIMGERQSSALFNIVKECRRHRRPYQHVPVTRLDHLSDRGNHQGVVALCAAKEFEPIEPLLERLCGATAPQVVLVPASVEDPGNLGAIIRSGAAFGVGAVLLETHNTAPLGATVAKTSAGMLERVSVSRPRALGDIIGRLRDSGFAVVGAEAQGKTALSTCNLSGNCVIILGGENRGIPPYLRKQCSSLVSIPIVPDVNSLNISVAAGILLYECVRQRAGK